MKRSASLLANLLMSSTLFWGVATASGEAVVVKEPVDFSSYCHIKFPPMVETTLSWDQPVLNENADTSIDVYGPCNYDPTGAEEIRAQQADLLRRHD